MRVDGTNLSMIRGDTESITVSCRDKETGEFLPFENGDTVYFTVKINAAVETKLIQKIIKIFDEGKAVIEIEPEDTKPLAYRSYRYDVQWVTAAGRVTTIVPPSTFVVEQEITFEWKNGE